MCWGGGNSHDCPVGGGNLGIIKVCKENHGSLIITVYTSGSRDQTSSAKVTELVLLVQQDVSVTSYLCEDQQPCSIEYM